MPAFVFRVDAELFDLDRYLLRSRSHDAPVFLLVHQHREAMSPGDRVFVYRSGNTPGIVAIARIEAAPDLMEDDAPAFWRRHCPGREWRVLVDVRELRLTPDSGMVSQAILGRDPRLPPFTAANTRLTPGQSEAIRELWRRAAIEAFDG